MLHRCFNMSLLHPEIIEQFGAIVNAADIQFGTWMFAFYMHCQETNAWI